MRDDNPEVSWDVDANSVTGGMLDGNPGDGPADVDGRGTGDAFTCVSSAARCSDP